MCGCGMDISSSLSQKHEEAAKGTIADRSELLAKLERARQEAQAREAISKSNHEVAMAAQAKAALEITRRYRECSEALKVVVEQEALARGELSQLRQQHQSLQQQREEEREAWEDAMEVGVLTLEKQQRESVEKYNAVVAQMRMMEAECARKCEMSAVAAKQQEATLQDQVQRLQSALQSEQDKVMAMEKELSQLRAVDRVRMVENAQAAQEGGLF
jgi:chromosome segregation ATPase